MRPYIRIHPRSYAIDFQNNTRSFNTPPPLPLDRRRNGFVTLPRSKTSPELYKTNPFEDASRQNSVINRGREEEEEEEDRKIEEGGNSRGKGWKVRKRSVEGKAFFSPLWFDFLCGSRQRMEKRGGGRVTMRHEYNSRFFREFFFLSSPVKGAILSGIADARICFQSIRKLVDREATERALVED